MEPAASASARTRLWTVGALAIAWLIPVTLAATQTRLRTLASGDTPTGWADAFLFQLPLWSPLLLIAPVAFRVARRWPLDGPRRLVHLGALTVVSLALAVAYLVLSAVVSVAVEKRPIAVDTVASASAALAVRTFHLELFIVAALIAAGYARQSFLRVQSASLRAVQLREQLTEARLSMLKAQLRPHFLFNVLHSIASLVDEDRAAAKRMIAALSDLLRHTLSAVDGQRTDLASELASADLYLAIERIRFQDRLRIQHSIAPETLAAWVPTLLLQPLVENAVIHGAELLTGASLIDIRAWAEGDDLVLQVRNGRATDDRPADDRSSVGIGLAHTRTRLAQLYRGKASLDLIAGPTTMTVTVRLPFEQAPPADGAG